MVHTFSRSYNTARQIKTAQDAYCAKVEEGRFDEVAHTTFPQDLQWEALVDVLRGRVKVQVHCYETVDLDDVVRVSYLRSWPRITSDEYLKLTNEFQFPVAAFHHAHEAYLVPDLLKQAYGMANSL